ncbi:MAG: type II toxin-antitoxin system HicB family antitoxin [Deltaproteobacteria bacterium]|nr:type II toxin-antitoxin system HicB family antitoxin [Deltaproteobacteria bacterium]
MFTGYPVEFEPDDNNTVIATCPDVPEALSAGQTESEALDWMEDALCVALSAYVDDNEDIPKPSAPRKGQPMVELPPMAVMKLTIYQSMRDQGVTQVELARRLNCDARQVRRILDLDHHSRLNQLEAALRALKKKLVIDIREAA